MSNDFETKYPVKSGMPTTSRILQYQELGLHRLGVGDGIFVPLPEGKTLGWLQSRCTANCRLFKQKHNKPEMEFFTERTIELGKEGCNIWRRK